MELSLAVDFTFTNVQYMPRSIVSRPWINWYLRHCLCGISGRKCLVSEAGQQSLKIRNIYLGYFTMHNAQI